MKQKTHFMISILILASTMLILYYVYSCQIKTYQYNKEINNLKQDIFDLNCYENKGITQEYFDINCKPLINKHNEMVKKWAALKCVNINLTEEDTEDVNSLIV